jgi:hypothetical protein
MTPAVKSMKQIDIWTGIQSNVCRFPLSRVRAHAKMKLKECPRERMRVNVCIGALYISPYPPMLAGASLCAYEYEYCMCVSVYVIARACQREKESEREIMCVSVCVCVCVCVCERELEVINLMFLKSQTADCFFAEPQTPNFRVCSIECDKNVKIPLLRFFAFVWVCVCVCV